MPIPIEMKDLGGTEAAVISAPEAPSDLDRLRDRVRRGDYPIDPEAVARAFLQWHLQNWRMGARS